LIHRQENASLAISDEGWTMKKRITSFQLAPKNENFETKDMRVLKRWKKAIKIDDNEDGKLAAICCHKVKQKSWKTFKKVQLSTTRLKLHLHQQQCYRTRAKLL